MTFAIPAKKSWKVVSQSDGTTIKVSQAGDEHLHYYITEDNVPLYEAADNRYCYLTIENGKLHNSGVLAHESAARSAKELQVMNTIHDLAPIARQMAAKREAPPSGVSDRTACRAKTT